MSDRVSALDGSPIIDQAKRAGYGELNPVVPHQGANTPAHRKTFASEVNSAARTASNTHRNPITVTANKQYDGQVICVLGKKTPEDSSYQGTNIFAGAEEESLERWECKVRVPELSPAMIELGAQFGTPDNLSDRDNSRADMYPTFIAQNPEMPEPEPGEWVKVKADPDNGIFIILYPLATPGGTGLSSGGGVGATNPVSSFLTGQAAQLLGSATVTSEVNTDAEIEEYNDVKFWPVRDGMRGETLNLVVFWHGTGYGDQDYVISDENYGLIRAMNELGKTINNTVFAIPDGPTAGFDDWTDAVNRFQNIKGVTFNEDTTIYGCWSGGSRGMTDSLNDGRIKAAAVYWADPSPQNNVYDQPKDAADGASAHVSMGESLDTIGDDAYYAFVANWRNNIFYYNDANWTAYDWSTENFAQMIEDFQSSDNVLTPQITAVDYDHNEILKLVLKLIGQRIS